MSARSETLYKIMQQVGHEAAELVRERRHLMYIRNRLPRAYATQLDLSIEVLAERAKRLDSIVAALERFDSAPAPKKPTAKENHNAEPTREGNRSTGAAEDGGAGALPGPASGGDGDAGAPAGDGEVSVAPDAGAGAGEVDAGGGGSAAGSGADGAPGSGGQ